MPVKLKTHRGVDITVTEAGQFQAMVPKWGPESRPDLVSNKDLRAIEAVIDQSIPKVTAGQAVKVITARVSQNYATGEVEPSPRDIDEPNVYTVAGIRHETNGRGRHAHTNIVTVGPDGKQVGGYYGDTYLYDAEVEADLLAIVAEQQNLAERWAFTVARLTPISRDEIIRRVETSAT
jgi:pyruvoyl-dependent arginine decarboxylase (PvlArgDC)